MAKKNNIKVMTNEQKQVINLNRKATKMALGSLHKRGMTMETLINDDNAIFTFDVMKSKYWLMFNNSITRDELIDAINNSWQQYQDRIPV